MNKEFVEKVEAMRRLQRQFFRERDHMTLSACKKAEKEVDRMCASYLGTESDQLKFDPYYKLF